MAIELNTLISRNREIISSKMDDEVVMMSIDRGNYYGLNPIAAQIWDMLTEPVTVDLICEKLMEEFDVSQDQCRSEVLTYLEKLESEGLIVVTH